MASNRIVFNSLDEFIAESVACAEKAFKKYHFFSASISSVDRVNDELVEGNSFYVTISFIRKMRYLSFDLLPNGMTEDQARQKWADALMAIDTRTILNKKNNFGSEWEVSFREDALKQICRQFYLPISETRLRTVIETKLSLQDPILAKDWVLPYRIKVGYKGILFEWGPPSRLGHFTTWYHFKLSEKFRDPLCFQTICDVINEIFQNKYKYYSGGILTISKNDDCGILEIKDTLDIYTPTRFRRN